MTLIDVVIENNESYSGGGLFAYNSNPVMDNVSVRGNVATGSGGGLYFFDCPAPELINIDVEENSAVSGAGVMLKSSHPHLDGAVISGNKAQERGGGLHCWGQSQPVLQNVDIFENEAYGEFGGGAYVSDGSYARFKNVLFNANQVTGKWGSGAAIGMWSARIDLENTTIADNYAVDRGDAIFCGEPGEVNIKDSILWDDVHFYYWDNILTVSYSDIQGGRDGITYEGGVDVSWGEGNIDVNPLFSQLEESHYRLRIDSPCIDAGDPASDYSVEPPPNGARVNMGRDGNTQYATTGLELSDYLDVDLVASSDEVFPGDSVLLSAAGGEIYEWYRNDVLVGTGGSIVDVVQTNASYVVVGHSGQRSGTATTVVEAINSQAWCNLQFPSTFTIDECDGGDIYGQVWVPGRTDSQGQGAGIKGWIGYSTVDEHPSTDSWTWFLAAYTGDQGPSWGNPTANDEYVATISGLEPGAYYYATRFQVDCGPYMYGGYSESGGGFWSGENHSGGLSVIYGARGTQKPQWANLQWPETVAASHCASVDIYAQVYQSGRTDAAGPGGGMAAWVGIGPINTDPRNDARWHWYPAGYYADRGPWWNPTANDEYKATISGLAPGDYAFVSRFQMDCGAFVYGGYSGGFWNGTNNASGTLSISP